MPDGGKLKSGVDTGKTESRTGRREKRVVSFSESDSEADEPSSSSRGKVGDGVFLKSIVESSENEELESEIRVEIHSGDQVNGVNNQTDESESEAKDAEDDDGDDSDDDEDEDDADEGGDHDEDGRYRDGNAILEALDDLPNPPRAPPHKQRWWVNRGETGNQTAPVTDGDDKTPENGSSLRTNTDQESTGSSSDEQEIDISALQDEKPLRSVSEVAPRLLYKAIASYEGDESSNELSLGKGDVVEVIQQQPDGWWMAVGQRQIGWVPSNYLRPLERPSPEVTRDTRL